MSIKNQAFTAEILHPKQIRINLFITRSVWLLFFITYLSDSRHAFGASAWGIFLSGEYGYTHYRAEDLNKFLVLLERKTAVGGFNPYQVERFDGHLRNGFTVGAFSRHMRIGLEAEFWTEKFKQQEVPFDLQSSNRTSRITCADLLSPGYVSEKQYGCIEATEYFLLVPVTLQVMYKLVLFRSLYAYAGYGMGFLAGDSEIKIKTRFYNNSHIDDEVTYGVNPGLNLHQKLFIDAEYRPFAWLGIEGRFGYRFLKLKRFKLADARGDSFVFNYLFNFPEEGEELFFESYPNTAQQDEIVIGTPSDKGRTTKLRHVQGDFTGWFAGLKLNLYWKVKR